MSTPNYDINYNDSRFTEVESDKRLALSELERTYGGMVNESDKYYKAQIDATKDWEATQKKQQQEQTDFAIEKIEQQKDNATKDYIKEQSGSYVDWQKQSNQYGADAEQKAAGGMAHSGYSESSQVAMYNQYQQRVVAARESFNRAVVDYNNAITEARLQNNAALAQIAFESLQKRLELSLQGFQYKNQLILEKTKQKTELERSYYDRYQDVIKQINTENALAEEARQYNLTHALQERSIALDEAKFAYQKVQDAKTSSGGSGGGSGGSSDGGSTKKSSGSKSSGLSIKKTVSGNADIDMDSVLALGYGPISEKKLAELVASGEVVEYTMGGKTKFKKANKTTKTTTNKNAVNKVQRLYGSRLG